MSGNELVSIVIPAYNAAVFIERTLASALAQTHSRLEILVVDDGSTDRTVDLVEAAARRDPRIRLFRRPRGGVAQARNFAIAEARGTLIAPLDADDLWHPDKLAEQVAALRQAGSSVGLVYCWSVGIDENDSVTVPDLCQSSAAGRVVPQMIECNLAGNASTPLIRRACLEAAGGYDPSLQAAGAQGTEDWKLYLALADRCDFAVVPRPLVGYRRSSTSMSANVAAMERSLDLLRAWFMAKWPELPRRHLRRHLFFANQYLASLALEQQAFGLALRYQLRACRARPLGVLHRASRRLAARMVALVLGRRMKLGGPKAALLRFGEFQETGAVP